MAVAVGLTAACGRTPSPEIAAVTSPSFSAIEVRGLPARDLGALARASLSREQWQQILRVSLDGSSIAMAGDYAAVDRVIRFMPMYGFDPGRSFHVVFDPAKIPGGDPADSWRQRSLSQTVGLAGPRAERSTFVRQIYPSGAELPENMLRFYLEFSAPMGRGDVMEHIRLVDDTGTDVVDPFLPVEAELWTPDRTRFTLFFDPGRVKRDIKPNREMGRALMPGKRYTLVVSEGWLDGNGQRLKADLRHDFSVARAIETSLDPLMWKIDAPKPGTRDPLAVTFPWALDYGLLQRALGVGRDGTEVPGAATVGPGETRWMFAPRDPWNAGDYTLVVLTLLEDPAGNRMGRAFEVSQATADAPDHVAMPFSVR